MKKLILSLLTVAFFCGLNAQEQPVNWKFSAKKIADKVYEIHMTASIDDGWHIYSQTQPKDAIALPTKFQFTKNPLIVTSGTVKEVGKMDKFYDATVKVSANQYMKTVDFVQKVTLKNNAKTAISGKVEFQTCDEEKCLPPMEVPFNVPLG